MYTPGPDGMFFSLPSSAEFMSVGAAGARRMGVPVFEEPPGLVLIFPCVVDTDARTRPDGVHIEIAILNPQRFAGQIRRIQFLGDGHRHTQLSGSAGDIG